MGRILPTLTMLAVLAVPTASIAQFGSFLRQLPSSNSNSTSSNTNSGGGGCDKSKPKSRGSALLGSVLGNVANRTLGGTGIAQFVPIPEVAGILSDAIACKLDDHEQKQAAAATTTAVRSGAVGSTSAWTSTSRPNVSGTSTVTGKTQTADGGSCLTVNDVVIVNGEETTVPKKMCRKPGASGYTIDAQA